MASNNNPPGYTPPVILDTSTMDVPSSTGSSSVLLPMETAPGYFCEISSKCQSENTSDAPKWLYCQQYDYDIAAYFSCVCKYTNTLSNNEYFSASCVLQECNGADARKQFLAMYRAACQQRGTSLIDISPGWTPYDQPLPPQSTATVSFQSLTSTQPGTLTQATSATSSPASLDVSTTQSTKTTTNTISSAMPTPTGPADGQIPICGISDKCMTKKPQGEPSCNTGDLDCICKVSNSLEKNTEFDQQCVLDACYGDIGREEFLDSLFYHCKKVNKELIDIPKRWEPYLPATFPSATPASVPPVDSNGSVSESARQPFKLTGGAIGGIVTAAVVVLIIVAGLIKLWWDSRKKANTLKKDNAKLQDATNPEGMSMRINTLISDSSIPEFASRRDTASAGRGADTSTYHASVYDATLIGSPRSMDVHPVHGYGTAPREYGTKTEDYNMSEYGDDKFTGHGRQYSRDHSRYELPDNENRGYQTAPNQENSDDDSMSRYSARRNSYGDETVDLQRQRGQDATSDWGLRSLVSGQGSMKKTAFGGVHVIETACFGVLNVISRFPLVTCLN